jgi:hypothetical protein
MLLAVSITCLVAMAACLAIAARGLYLSRDAARTSYAAFALALAFALLAAAAAAVHEKVASPASASTGGTAPPGGTAAAPAPGGTVQSYPVSADDLRSFRGLVGVQYQPTGRRLCLVNYFNGAKELGKGRSYKFWAGCGASDRWRTVADVQEGLALPSAWDPRNARVIACVPRGATMPYLSGPAAAQWSEKDRHLYRGGAVQYRVLSFDTNWIVKRQAVPAAPQPLSKVGNPC